MASPSPAHSDASSDEDVIEVASKGKARPKVPSKQVPNELQAAAARTSQNLYSKKTRSNYKSYLEAGRKFLETFDGGDSVSAFDTIDEGIPTALLAFTASKCDINGAFTNYFKSLKNKYGRENVAKQSLPMSYKDLSVITEHLQKPETIERKPLNEELLRLQKNDIELDLKTDSGSPYMTITLTFRKTNQADPTKGSCLL
ncbi:hypothetical protein BGZ65_006066 [Modicella reniformis]|uniref:Uncharacterized protein n=1 Tax=Modicella reniformis TaxID=1440133 RepID=A0A9P6SP83_9FUNG|nr:hypothetical protein BGZ65_006066 [Modicella reniformis]